MWWLFAISYRSGFNISTIQSATPVYAGIYLLNISPVHTHSCTLTHACTFMHIFPHIYIHKPSHEVTTDHTLTHNHMLSSHRYDHTLTHTHRHLNTQTHMLTVSLPLTCWPQSVESSLCSHVLAACPLSFFSASAAFQQGCSLHFSLPT